MAIVLFYFYCNLELPDSFCQIVNIVQTSSHFFSYLILSTTPTYTVPGKIVIYLHILSFSHLVQVLSTRHLSAERLVFPNTDLQHGVTHLEYLQHINRRRPGLDLSQSLLQAIQAIENTLLCKSFL